MFKAIEWFDTLPSTQTYLKEHPDTPMFKVIAAKHQSAGYGRQGAPWQSNHFENLLFSYKQPTAYDTVRSVWEVVLVGCVEYLKANGLKAHIKPPNDVYVNDLKIAGILVETKQEASLVAYVGVGLNVNQASFSEELKATSMTHHTKQTYVLNEVLNDLLESISHAMTLSPQERLIWYTNHIEFNRYRVLEEDREVTTIDQLDDGMIMIENRAVHPSLLVYELNDKI